MKASVCFNLINDSESIDAYITSIREFVNNKDLEAALDVYEHLLTINPDDAGALFSKSSYSI
ncbi:hypothetical protein [Methanohalophilus euhalobius]|uniref:hypothetical protein n=1 Tax=Methanohalophilus euhalobius TaxID=51203 RepID=UPI001043B6E8|nr:hypothetical protein [Methanohalophilus euhalobius]